MAEQRKVDFVNIPAQYQDVTDEIVDFVRCTMAKGAFVGGPALDQFERSLAGYMELVG